MRFNTLANRILHHPRVQQFAESRFYCSSTLTTPPDPACTPLLPLGVPLDHRQNHNRRQSRRTGLGHRPTDRSFRRLPWLPDNPAAKTATRARLLWDADALYFFADMDDGDLFADITEHDGHTWNNDVFEIFLKPALDKQGYYEFQVNAAGTQIRRYAMFVRQP